MCDVRSQVTHTVPQHNNFWLPVVLMEMGLQSLFPKT